MAIPYLLHGDIGEKGTYLRQTAGHYDIRRHQVPQRAASPASMRRTRNCGRPASSRSGTTACCWRQAPRPSFRASKAHDLPGVHTCWTLADAREIAKIVAKGAPVVLVGAGFIGSIVLEALHKTGCELTVVEIAPRMVARMMDETAGGMLGRWCTKQGVRVLTNTKVERI